jgi:AcrR family transcriptional regulator
MMAIRQRAIQAEDKQERHAAILDAAERLLAHGSDRSVSVAEVADEAGLAKGTVYLYFPGKEELLLAVHERAIDGFFRDVIERVEGCAALTVDDMLALTRRHIVEPPLFLRLAAHCFGFIGQGASESAATGFRQRMDARLARAGAGIERHFGDLAPGSGVVLLRHSYALIIGLWMMASASGEAGRGGLACGNAGSEPVPFPLELDRALRALWQGTLAAAAKAAGR